jgi:hypothetical protein
MKTKHLKLLWLVIPLLFVAFILINSYYQVKFDPANFVLRSSVTELVVSLEGYRDQYGVYPSTEGVCVPISDIEEKILPYYRDGYFMHNGVYSDSGTILEKVFNKPYFNLYFYSLDGSTAEVMVQGFNISVPKEMPYTHDVTSGCRCAVVNCAVYGVL